MIFYLRGQIVHIEEDFIVIEVQGVAYQVFCTNPYAFTVSTEEVVVYIHQHVREDAITLYGFSSREEQKLFKRLLDVSGIGPRVALGILSGAKPEAIVSAVQTENITFLTKLPGIGKKTAQRMILDLKDKLSDMGDWNFSLEAAATGTDDLFSSDTAGDLWAEAKEGLKALGYTEAEADGALRKVRVKTGEDVSVDEVMRQALQSLFKP